MMPLVSEELALLEDVFLVAAHKLLVVTAVVVLSERKRECESACM